MKFKIVTTFKDIIRKIDNIDLSTLNDKARRHWEKNGNETISFGMRLAQQAEERLPSNASLLVYYEGDRLPENTSKVEFVPHRLDKVEQFKSISKHRWIEKKKTHYSYKIDSTIINRKHYDYEFDAVRFCHPPFALIDAIDRVKERYLISMDADVNITKKIPEDFFPSLVESKAHNYYLSRHPHKHMESGFIIWDTHHEHNDLWWSEYKKLYEDGEIYNLYEGWTDCHAFDYVNSKLKKEVGLETHHIASAQTHNVWEYSRLQKYMSHHKGIAI